MYACEKKAKPSKYKGVSWHTKNKKWYVQLKAKEKKVYGGIFQDELDAAKRVNQLCEKFGIPLLNPEISAKTNQQYQVTEKYVLSHGVGKKSKL